MDVKNIDSGLLISITALDLSEVFDSVDHGVLLSKMGWYGIPPHWFDSYLGDRKQMVRGGASALPVSCGVPQGSIIDPTLFCLAVNEIKNFLPHGRLISYADETQLFDSWGIPRQISPPPDTLISPIFMKICPWDTFRL